MENAAVLAQKIGDMKGIKEASPFIPLDGARACPWS